MNRIWRMEFDFDIVMTLTKPDADGLLPIDISHHIYRDEIKNFQPGLPMGNMKRRPRLAVDLTLTKEDFGYDYFSWGGAKFASKRMRKAMGLKAPQVRFYQIDDSQSAPLVRSKKYRLMEVLAREQAADLEKTANPELEEAVRSLRQKTMTSRKRDLPPYKAPPRLVIRQGFTPTHNLFFDNDVWSPPLCSEAFATRVLKAGCTGMTFVDPNSYRRDGLIFRTLRGVEKQVETDPLSGAMRTEVIEVIE